MTYKLVSMEAELIQKKNKNIFKNTKEETKKSNKLEEPHKNMPGNKEKPGELEKKI